MFWIYPIISNNKSSCSRQAILSLVIGVKYPEKGVRRKDRRYGVQVGSAGESGITGSISLLWAFWFSRFILKDLRLFRRDSRLFSARLEMVSKRLKMVLKRRDGFEDLRDDFDRDCFDDIEEDFEEIWDCFREIRGCFEEIQDGFGEIWESFWWLQNFGTLCAVNPNPPDRGA